MGIGLLNAHEYPDINQEIILDEDNIKINP